MRTPDNTRSADAVLGAQVRAARLSRGVSLRSLAGSLEVSPATLSLVENGRTGLSAVRLNRIADVLEMAVAEILDIIVDSGGSRLGQSSAAAVPAKEAGLVSSPPEGGLAAADPDISDWRAYAPLDFDPVLRAALEEILAVGYHGATVRGIAARAELSVSGIYHYYTSKQQMLMMVLERTMTELLARARAARAEGEGAVGRFVLLIENLALFHTHRKELGFVGASEMRSLEGRNWSMIAAMRTTQQRMVDEEVHQAVRTGHFRTEYPNEAARASVTMCTALANWWQRDGALSPEQVAARYVEFALGMFR